MDLQKKFSEFVKYRRKKIGMTQTELNVKATGANNHKLIGDIENMKTSFVSSTTMDKILKALNCDVQFIELDQPVGDKS